MKGNWSTLGRSVVVLALVGLAALGFVRPAQAADFRTGDVVVVAAGEVIDDDLFAMGQRVEVNGTVKGDLFAMGSTVTVNGDVEGSLFIAGQTTEVNGSVGGSVYGGAYSLTVGPEAAIGRNLYFGGYSLETSAGSALGRSLYVGGYQAILGGDVAYDVRAGVGAAELNGSVGRDVVLEVGDTQANVQTPPGPFFSGMPAVHTIQPGVRIGPDAKIAGDLWYESKLEQAIPAASVGGDVTFVTPVPAPQPAPESQPERVSRQLGLGASLFRGISTRIGEFIALVIVGGLLLRFWPEAVHRVGAQAQQRPLGSTGWGFLVTVAFFVGVPLVAIAIFAVAVLGGLVTYGQLFNAILGLGAAALGLTVTSGLFILALVTKAIIAYVVGRLVLSRLAPASLAGRWGELLSLAAGALLYEVLRAIPLGLGWVIGAIVTLVGVGAIYYVVREVMRPAAAPAVTPVAAA